MAGKAQASLTKHVTREERSNRVWIELEAPRDDEHAKQIEARMKNVMDRLLGPRTELPDNFFWSKSANRWCYGGQGGYTELADNGRWFNLDYLGR